MDSFTLCKQYKCNKYTNCLKKVMLLIQAYDEQSAKLAEYRLQSFTYTTYQTQTEKGNK